MQLCEKGIFLPYILTYLIRKDVWSQSTVDSCADGRRVVSLHPPQPSFELPSLSLRLANMFATITKYKK